MTRHKHADLIIAWANGAIIEVWWPVQEKWVWCESPTWEAGCKYRIKPESKPDYVKIGNVYESAIAMHPNECIANASASGDRQGQIRIIFDGEKRQIKGVELIEPQN